MIRTAYIEGIQAHPVTVRVTPTESGGLVIEGLNEAARRETTVRVRAAMVSHGIAPIHARVTFEGLSSERGRTSGFDLPIALALRAAAGGVPLVPEVWAFGELSFMGEVRHSYGAELVAELAIAEGGVLIGRCAGSHHPSHVVALTLADAIYQSEHLAQAVREPDTFGDLPLSSGMLEELDEERLDSRLWPAVRAAMVAATGGFGLLLVGPPGSGKTMLARRIARMLPEPTGDERRQLRRIASVAALPTSGKRPFRAPHHTASTTAVQGGGRPLRPGERTLASGGVLFLDELPENYRATLAAFGDAPPAGMPADHLLVAAMNVCPCGWAGSVRPCACKPMAIQAYTDRVADFRKRHLQITVRLEAFERHEPGPFTVGELRQIVTEARRLLAEYAHPRSLALTDTDRLALAHLAVDRATAALFPNVEV